jgi:hypothetical protein
VLLFEAGSINGNVLNETEAAIDGQDLTCDKRGSGGQEEDRLRHIFGRTVALQRRTGSKTLRKSILLALKTDKTGSYAVDADRRRKGFGHGLREHVESGLGGAVVGVRGPGPDAAEGTDVDDAALSSLEMGQSLAGNKEGAAGIGLEDAIPTVEGERSQIGRFVDGGVVDEEIEMAEMSEDRGDGLLNGLLGADIAGNGNALRAQGFNFRGEGQSAFMRCAVGDGDAGAGLCTLQSDGATETTRATCDENGFAVQRCLRHDLPASTVTA